MKTFQVVRRGSQWHVHLPHSGRGVHGSEDKERIIAWACEEARRFGAEVRIMDRGGRLEATYCYADGTEIRTVPDTGNLRR